MRPGLLAALFLAFSTAALPAANTRTVSGSGQFIIYCPDQSLRSNLAGAFDDIRRGLFSELNLRLGSEVPIYVNIAQRKIVEYNAPAWNLRWLEAPEGSRVQLDILVDDEMERSRLQQQIVRALLLTLKYQEKPPAEGVPYANPPSWLVEGLSERIRLQTSEPDAAFFRGLLDAKNTPPLSEWFAVDPAVLDSTSLGIYRGYACALVSFFESEPNGKSKLLQFLQKAPAETAGSIAWLAANFPNLGPAAKNLPKWWSLSLAKLSASDRYEAWSAEQTEETLAKSLNLKITDKGEAKVYPIEQFADYAELPGCKAALEVLSGDLIRLTLHAHPLFRPVILSYQEIVGRLQRGKLKGLDLRMAELRDLRQQLLTRLSDVSDYLTWFQTTQMKKGPSEFVSYFRLMDSFKTPPGPAREPIGQYLDAMEAELKK